MFGFGRDRKEATQVGEAAARMAIMPFWDMFARAFDTRIWSDPYVLGVIQGSITAQTLPITGRKLSTTDKGFVVLDAMRKLGASQPAIELALTLAQDRDPDYARGHDNAVVTVLLMAEALKEEAYSEPDIIEAQAAVPGFEKLWASLGNGPFDPPQSLATAYIYMKVTAHKKLHYPS